MASVSQHNRQQQIIDELKDSSGDRERHLIPWKGTQQLCDVIRLRMTAVVLNPRSHRLQAQLASHPDRDTVQTAPTEAAAQDILADLIRKDDTYEDLKANLAEEGQRQPGVITRTGLLVNGNRRAVALRELNNDYIRVAVLPPAATEREIAELELKLQMTREFKQNYTFTNQLLFVEELHTRYEHPLDGIALMLRYAQSSDQRHVRKGVAKVEQVIRILAMIREIQRISQDRIGYEVFDDQRVSLEELDTSYEKLKKDDPDAAERLRLTRFIGLILESGYMVLRQMNEDFFESYLAPALSEDQDLSTFLPSEAVLGGVEESTDDELNLGLLAGAAETETEASDPGPFLSWLAGLEEYTPHQTTGDARVTVHRDRIREQVRQVLDGAAELAKQDHAREQAAEAPGNRLKEATGKIRRARSQLRNAMEDSEFDQNDFTYRVRKLEKAVRDLRAHFDKIGAR